MNTTRQTLLYLLLAWVTPNVLAEERALHFNVPPQSLGAALDSLAQQGHLQIIYDPDTVGSRSSRALAGTYTPRASIGRMTSMKTGPCVTVFPQSSWMKIFGACFMIAPRLTALSIGFSTMRRN